MFLKEDALKSLGGPLSEKGRRSRTIPCFLTLFALLISPLHAHNFEPFKPHIHKAQKTELRGAAREIADTLPIALYSLSTYYIDRPDLQKLTLTALQKLGLHIAGLKFKNVNQNLNVYLHHKMIYQSVKLPEKHDYKGWSVLLIKILEKLEKNYALSYISTELMLHTLLKGITKPLDKMTTYIPPSPIKGQLAQVKKTKKRDLSIKTERYKDVFYIKIPHFEQRTFPQIIQKIKAAHQKYKGIILDLRENFGGDFIQAVEITDSFLKKGVIASSQGRHPESFQKFYADKKDYIGDKKMVILVNRNSASASEVLAAALKDAGRAIIIGKKTYGKGTIQRVQELPNGGSIVMTWAKLFSPKGTSWDKKGLTPHIDTRNAEAFLARFSGYKVPEGLDHDMRVAYLILNAPGVYKETLSLQTK